MSQTHQLIYSATSPFAPKVRIAALEKKIEALADGMTDSLVSVFIERNKRAQETQSTGWMDRQFSQVQLGLTIRSRPNFIA